VGSGLEDQRDGQRSRRGKPRDAVVTEGVDSVACGLRVKRGILAAVGLCTKGICSPASPSPQGCASPGPTAALLFMGRKPDLCLIAAPLLNGRQGGLRSRSGGAHRSERAEIVEGPHAQHADEAGGEPVDPGLEAAACEREDRGHRLGWASEI
jgi:hypothetical protein